MGIFDGKTKIGTIICGVGMAIYQTVDLCPMESWMPWIKWLGAIISILGGSTAVYGLAHKVDKVANTQKTFLTQLNVPSQECPPAAPPDTVVAPKGTPLTEERFLDLLREARKKVTPAK